MTRYPSQTHAAGGYYFNTSTYSLHAVEGRGGRLPGTPGTLWVRLPTVAMIVLAIVLSLGFVVFLPLIGFALVLRAVSLTVVRRLEKRFQTVAGAHWPWARPGGRRA